MRSAWTVLVTKGLDIVTEFAQGRCSGRAGKASPYNYDFVLSFVRRIHQFHILAMLAPFFCKRTRWTLSVKYHVIPPTLYNS
jgi:hypothetical protein